MKICIFPNVNCQRQELPLGGNFRQRCILATQIYLNSALCPESSTLPFYWRLQILFISSIVLLFIMENFAVFVKPGGHVHKRTSSSVFGTSDADSDDRPPIISTDLGGGVFSFTAGIKNLTLNSSTSRVSKQRNTKSTPNSSPQRPAKEDSPQIGAIRVHAYSNQTELGVSHWLDIFVTPSASILISAPYSEIFLCDLILRILEGNKYPPEFDDSPISQLVLGESLEGQRGRKLLLRIFRLLVRENYDQAAQDHIHKSIYGQQDEFGNDSFCSKLLQGPIPTSFLFVERIAAMLTNILNENFLLAHYPNCDIDIILAQKVEPRYQISHIWQLRCSSPHVQVILFPTTDAYISTAVGTILIRSDPENSLSLEITTDFPTYELFASNAGPTPSNNDAMDTGDIIPPPTKPAFLSSTSAIVSEFVVFSNISNKHPQDVVTKAVEAFVIGIGQFDDFTQHINPASITAAITARRPVDTRSRESKHLIDATYDIHFPILRLDVGGPGMPSRYMSFRIDGLIQSIVFVQFLSQSESAVFRRPDTTCGFVLRGIVHGWDPLDTKAINGAHESLLPVLSVPFVLLRGAIEQSMTVVGKQGRDIKKKRQEPVILLLVSRAHIDKAAQDCCAELHRQNPPGSSKKKQPSRYLRWSCIGKKQGQALTGDAPILVCISEHFGYELVHLLHAFLYPITQPNFLDLSSKGFFNHIIVPRFTQTVGELAAHLGTLGIIVEFIFPFKSENSLSKGRYLADSAPDGSGYMWGTCTQHGHQAVIIDQVSHNVTCCHRNTILRKEHHAWYLGSIIRRLLAPEDRPGSYVLAKSFVHRDLILEFARKMDGIPDVHSARLFPSMPNLSVDPPSSSSSRILHRPILSSHTSSRQPSTEVTRKDKANTAMEVVRREIAHLQSGFMQQVQQALQQQLQHQQRLNEEAQLKSERLAEERHTQQNVLLQSHQVLIQSLEVATSTAIQSQQFQLQSLEASTSTAIQGIQASNATSSAEFHSLLTENQRMLAENQRMFREFMARSSSSSSNNL